MELGSLQRSNRLRDVWPDEARDFTPWLAKHLSLLGEELGMELDLQDQEYPVGTYRADIRAKELGTGRSVLIENQLEATNHSHLGQIITYAAGIPAEVVVWICREVRAEHRRALEWLNRGYDADQDDAPAFFAVEVELLMVDASRPAVHFRTVVSPRNWNVEAKAEAGDKNTSQRGAKYAEFFQELIDELRTKHQFTNARVGQPQNWYAFTAGVRGFKYSVSFANGGRLRAEIYIDTGDEESSERAFNELYSKKAEIELEFEEPLEWERLEDRRACRIATYRPGSIDEAADAFKDYKSWAVEKMLKFKRVFGPRISLIES